MNSYKVVDATGLTSASLLEAEINGQIANSYYLNSVINVGGKYYLVFATASVNRIS